MFATLGVPLTDIANTSFPSMLLNPFPTKFAAVVSVTVPVILPTFVTPANACTLSKAPEPDIVNGDDPPNITKVPAVTNAAVNSASLPVIVCAFVNVTFPVVFPPIVDSTVLTIVPSAAFEIVITTSSSFATTLSNAA